MVTPRTIPIRDEEGKRQYVKINQEQGMPMDFDTNVLNVVLKAGASFQVQKSRTIMMVKEMMGMSPLFGQFMAEKGLNFILDNMDGKGIEELKARTIPAREAASNAGTATTIPTKSCGYENADGYGQDAAIPAKGSDEIPS
jgi:hypothetical protein